MSDRACLRAIFRNLADTLVCGAGGGAPLGFLWQSAAGPAVRTLEDIGCNTKLFWQQCGQSISHSSSIPLSHRVTHLVTCSLSHLLLFGMPDESLLPALWCSRSRRLILLSPPPAPLYLTSSSHISLSPVLFPTLVLSLALSPPSTIPPLMALIPPLLTHTISPPPHPVPTLKLSVLTSLMLHAALSPLQNSGFRTGNL